MPLFHQLRHEIASSNLRQAGAAFHLALLRDMHARKFNFSQPRVPAGNPDSGQWVGDNGGAGGGAETLVQPAFVFAPVAPIIVEQGVVLGAAFFAWLSSRNGPNRQATIEFNAKEYRADGTGTLDLSDVQSQTLTQVNEACPRFDEVQRKTDVAAEKFRIIGAYMTPQQFGTAVHQDLKQQVDRLGDPNFIAERSYLKDEGIARYGSLNSIRIDILENAGQGTTRVYDIKTGKSGLNSARSFEIANHALIDFPQNSRIIVTEVRPSK